MTKSPSRTSGYAAALNDATARHGLICFLCGQVHSRSDTLQPDYIKPLDAGGKADSDNTVPVCKTCAKRRNRRPLGVYFRQRLIEAQRELDYLHRLGENRELFAAMAATISLVPHAVDGTGHIEPVEAKPWENLAQPVRVFNYDRLTDAEYVAGWPAEWLEPQHGDVYQEVNKDYVFDSADQKWVTLEAAQERGEFPEDWPPADAVQHGL